MSRHIKTNFDGNGLLQMASLRFVQTGDWHLGQPYRNVGLDLAPRLRAARLEAVGRVLQQAKNLGAAFVLATGDQFDGPNPDPSLVRELLERIAAFPDVMVHMIPGNHDPSVPGSVYSRAGFRPPKNLHLHLEPKPVALPDLGATLYPCPCSARYGPDPMAWIGPRSPGDGLRIALAHGSLPQFAEAEHRNYPILAEAPSRYDLDYVALGDWHTATPWPEDRPDDRMYYAGAPEIGGWDEPAAGTALALQIEPDRAPSVTLLRVGGFTWHDLAPDLHNAADIHDLFAQLDRLLGPRGIVRVRPVGRLGPIDRKTLEEGINQRSPDCAGLRLDLDALRLADDEVEDDLDLLKDPLLRAVADRLARLASDPNDPLPEDLPTEVRKIDPEILARARALFRDLLPRRP
ncbi:hypothetical protein BH23PLA1_BH23PLA1_40390 [soil metagenome]